MSDLVKVVCGVIVTPDDKVILGRRKPHSKYAGKLDFPGGKVEPGEQKLQALSRELTEELGIRVLRAKELGNFKLGRETLLESVELTLFYVDKWIGCPYPFTYSELVLVDLDVLRLLGDFLDFNGLSLICQHLKGVK